MSSARSVASRMALEPLRPDCTGTSVVSPSAIAPFEGRLGRSRVAAGPQRRAGTTPGRRRRCRSPSHRLERVDRGGEDVPAVEVARITEKPIRAWAGRPMPHQRRFLRGRSGLLVVRSGTNGSVANGVVRQPGHRASVVRVREGVTVYEAVGGEPYFTALVKRFCEVAADDLLRPMYPRDLSGAEERLRLFLMQYWGGPTTYSTSVGILGCGCATTPIESTSRPATHGCAA